MVNYSSLPVYVPGKLLRKESSSRVSSASTSSSSVPDAVWATSGLSGDGFHQAEPGHANDAPAAPPSPADGASADGAAYFHFSEEQQDALLLEARANAAALVVDVLSDFDKWQFVAARGAVNVFELRADAADRVSSMVPPPSAAPLAHHMHTMLGMTRVRAKLDDFMRILASRRRETFQDVETCLFEDRVQLADVFTSFGAAVGGRGPRRPSADGLSSSRGPLGQPPSADDVDMEQYAIKYVALKPVPSKQLSGSGASASASASSSSTRKFGAGRAARRRQRAAADDAAASQGLVMCLGEYATIRRGKVRAAPAADSLAASGRDHRSQSASSSSSSGSYGAGLEDQRIGIIAQHSMEDPAVTRYCKPIVLSDASSSASSSSASLASSGHKALAFASRSLVQFSGLVVYPVASSTPGESLLEVLVKLSVYDPSARGVTPATRLNMLAYVSAFQKLENALLVMRLRESPFLTSRNWVRGRSRKCCFLCQSGFSSFRRKHHCRLCGEVTCSKCSDVHQVKLGRAGKCPFRICAQCVHGADDALRLQRRRGSSNEDAVAGADGDGVESGPAQQPQDEEDEEDEEDGESDPARRRDHFAPPQRAVQDPAAVAPIRHMGVDGGMRKMAASTSSNASSTSGSSGSELFDSRGLLASSGHARSSGQSRTRPADSRKTGGGVTLTSLSATSSSASTVRTTTGSDQSPTRYGVASSSVSESSSPASPGSAALSEGGDSFYARFSEMSLMDLHDSEFDLSLKGMAARPTGFEFDDSERGSDNELDDIGEEDGDEFDVDDNGFEVDIDAMPASATHGRVEFDVDDNDYSRESGFEFHDSEVGIDVDADELDVDAHLGRLIDAQVEEEGEDELDDSDEDVLEVIETSHSGPAARPAHGSLAVLDQIRAARLAEYGILDSGKEHIYDVVARQAAQHLECALATVSFVDARREYVKAAFGAPLGARDIPKAHSLTAAIMRRCLLEDRDVVVVPDARADDLLSANKFVYEAPFVRFAVGVPIKAVSDGTILGALVVADPRQRPGDQLGASQERMLRDLAEQVSALLEDRLARTIGSSGSAAAGPGQMRERLADLLSQSYHTGLQVQRNEHKILSSSGSSVSSGSGAGSLSTSMLGSSSSSALSASMLGGSGGRGMNGASGSRFNASSSGFNPSGSRFDASASRITPRPHRQGGDEYSNMYGIEL